MKKLNRSKLLSLVTVGAIVVTTAFSFAAWDTLTAEKTGTLLTDKKVTNTATVSKVFEGDTSRTWGDVAPSYEGQVKFEVAGVTAYDTAKLSLVPIVKEGESDVSSQYQVKIYDGTDKVTDITQTKLDETITASNVYTVVITPNDDTEGGKNITVGLKGTLSQKTS